MGDKTITKKVGIYWLASYPRSGNTWVRMFLRAYMKGHCDINDHEDVVKGVHGHLSWQSSAAPPVHYLTFDDRLDYLPAALKNTLYLANGSDVRLKTHDANAEVHGRSLIPKGVTKGGVYLVRDPRDVAISYAAYKGCSIDDAIEKMADETHAIGPKDSYSWHFLGKWSSHVMSWASEIAPKGVLCCRYEDMKTKPLVVFKAIIQAMGLPLRGDKEVQAAIDEVEFSKLQNQESQNGFEESEHKTESFFRKGVAGGWKSVLSGTQVEKIEQDHGGIMKSLGYELVTEKAEAKA